MPRGKKHPRRGKQLTHSERAYIAISVQNGHGVKALAREFKCGPKTIREIHQKWVLTKDVKNAPGQGRKRKTTEREDRTIVNRFRKKSKQSAAAFTRKEAPTFVSRKISADTVRRRLKEAGKNGRVCRRKPYLRAANKAARLEWATHHQHWTVQDWSEVIFSDEAPFHLWQSSGRVYCWRGVGEEFLEENLASTVKHGGGSIQVWGCFNYNYKGPLYRIHGIMDADKYKQILIHQARPFLDDLERDFGFEPIFQHDNDPKHKSKKVKNYMEKKNYAVLDWPSQSPDLNPIENLWHILKTAIHDQEYKATSLDDVLRIAQHEWDCIPMDTLQKLLASMPDRCKAVIEAKGGHTKY
jgi:transposase